MDPNSLDPERKAALDIIGILLEYATDDRSGCPPRYQNEREYPMYEILGVIRDSYGLGDAP